MNRNTELHFSQAPQVNIKRSMFDRSFGHKTTFNEGELVPIFVDEVLPGDTYKVKTNHVIRMSTPIKPVMDNAWVDIYYFFVPNRLVWEHWQEFMGENNTGEWDENEVEYNIPTLTTQNDAQFKTGSVADHMGLPPGVNMTINALPLRAYVKIYNEWFRDQNNIAPLDVQKDIDGNQNLTSTNLQNAIYGGPLLKVAKLHDYFTSALPEPQKGDAVTVPLGDTAPVIGNGQALTFMTNPALSENSIGRNQTLYIDGGTNTYRNTQLGEETTLPTAGIVGGAASGAVGLTDNPNKSGVIADLSQATQITINQLRQAFQIQRLFEKDARGGTRYIEIIKSHFGVTSPDARMQRPEYLGGRRMPINMAQVLQTSASQETSPQGNTAAYSLTGGSNESFTKSFTEHGYIIGLAAVRVEHSYQQGIEKMWSRSRRFDFYWPTLANIGEQPILNKEIKAQGTDEDDEVFGYQEAWAEYRYKPNTISGELRSTYAQSLDIWHYGDYYNNLPKLSKDWIEEGTENIDRTLTVQSSNANQFIADFYFDVTTTRPMPIYSIPGLIDHN